MTARKSFKNAFVTVPIELLEALEVFRFPPQLDKRLQELMDRNNEGLLSAADREQLEGFVELSEKMALHRGKIRHLLNLIHSP